MSKGSYRALLAGAFLSVLWPAAQGTSGELASRVRQPVAVVCADSGKTVIVGNKRSGSVSLVDAAANRVIAEHDVGQSLFALAMLKDEQRLLAVDRVASELVLLDYRDRAVSVRERLRLGHDPTGLTLLAGSELCAVASLWSRRISFVSIAERPNGSGPVLALAGEVELPFCPGEMTCLANDAMLVVADSFGGRLAVIDCKRRVISSMHTIPAHNIRGMSPAPDGKTLVIVHQHLNHLAQTTFDDVHWGLLIRNHLRVLRTDAILATGGDSKLLDGGRLFDLGDVGYAAGDPGAMAFAKGGELILALAGVDEIGITASPAEGPRRVMAGARPQAVAPSPDGSLVYVANGLDDTVSVIAIKTGMNLATIALGPRPEPTSALRGERLFYSAKLSHDGWMSCHSCHSDGHTNNLQSDTLGDGSFGAAKRVPSLLGVSATGPWTWTGSITRLEDQVRKSIATTMHGNKLNESQVADLKAYLDTLGRPDLGKPASGLTEPAAVAAGRAVFEERKCATCHAPPEYTSSERYDVGVRDEVGNHEFNPPSLSGVSRRDAFFHDSRARTLEGVFQSERHPRGLVLSGREISELVSFLKTL